MSSSKLIIQNLVKTIFNFKVNRRQNGHYREAKLSAIPKSKIEFLISEKIKKFPPKLLTHSELIKHENAIKDREKIRTLSLDSNTKTDTSK